MKFLSHRFEVYFSVKLINKIENKTSFYGFETYENENEEDSGSFSSLKKMAR